MTSWGGKRENQKGARGRRSIESSGRFENETNQQGRLPGRDVALTESAILGESHVETGSTDLSATQIRCFFAPNEAH
jgi:hypothetical protein